MHWSRIAQIASDVVAIILIIRLLKLRLHSVYRVFCIFLVFDLVASLITTIESVVKSPSFDYRLTWIGFRLVAWALYLCLVYGLLDAILSGLPGIKTLSKKILNGTFALVVALGLLTIRLDIAVSGSSGFLAGLVDPIARAVRITLDLERVISTVALGVILLIMIFLLWFPVRIPKNLAVFSFGFVVYFSAKTALLLSRGIWSKENMELASTLTMFIVSACYVYWILFLTPQGEDNLVQIGHLWQKREQKRLLGELEAMNASLLRVVRR